MLHKNKDKRQSLVHCKEGGGGGRWEAAGAATLEERKARRGQRARHAAACDASEGAGTEKLKGEVPV